MAEEEEEEEETEEEGGKGGVSKIWMYLSIVLLVLLIITSALAVVFYLQSEKKKDHSTSEPFEREKPALRGRSLNDSDFGPHPGDPEVKVIWSKRNFTDANQVCNHQSPDGRFMFPKDDREEMISMQQFINIYNKESESEKTKECGNEYFVGLRKAKDKEFITSNDNFLMGPPLTSVNYSQELDSTKRQCFNLHLPYGQVFSFDCQHSTLWNCFLCQRQCPTENAYCYQIYYDDKVFDYNSAKIYCEKTSPPSELAVIPHQSVISNIRQQYPNKMQRCNSVGIGQRFSQKYESIDETPTPYKSNRFSYPSSFDKHLTMNCVVVNVDNEFLWELEHCTEPHCFVCVTSNNNNNKQSSKH